MKLSLLTEITEVVWPWQVTNYRKLFYVGSLRLTRGRIIRLPADHDIREQQRGLSEAAPSRNGSRPDKVPFYGFMENVRSPIRIPSQWLIIHPLGSGRREKRHLVWSSIRYFRLQN